MLILLVDFHRRKHMEFKVKITLTREDGKPQGQDAVGEALREEIELLAFDVDGREDGEISAYEVHSVEAI